MEQWIYEIKGDIVGRCQERSLRGEKRKEGRTNVKVDERKRQITSVFFFLLAVTVFLSLWFLSDNLNEPIFTNTVNDPFHL